MKYFFLCLLILPSLGHANTAKVKFMKGKVTKLLPGAKAAKPVSKNDEIPEDTSIVTSKGSVVKLSFPDGSVYSLGPNSKMVVSLVKKGQGSMIGFLKGVIRAEVEKTVEKNQNSKVIIKTRTAAMGVRGTKFKTSYNPQTQITSLVTIEGEVAMVKVKREDEVMKKLVKEEEGADNIRERENISERKSRHLEDLLQSKEAVEVHKGRYAGVIDTLDKPTVPTRIAPTQMIMIAANDDLADEKIDSKQYAKELVKEYTDTEDEAQPEGFFDKEDQILAPKAGGLVDFDTGVYVPPNEKSKLNKETKIYIATNEIGTVKSNGDYKAPKGLSLDARVGFVADKKSGLKANRDELDALNEQTVRTQLKQKERKKVIEEEQAQPEEEKEESEVSESWYSVKNHSINFHLSPFFAQYKIKNKNIGFENKVVTKEASLFGFEWVQLRRQDLRTSFFFGAERIVFSDDGLNQPLQADNEEFMKIKFSVEKKFYEDSWFVFDIALQDTPYFKSYNNGSSSQVYVSTFFNPRIGLGLKQKSFSWKKFEFTTEFMFHLFISQEDEHSDNSSSSARSKDGYSFDLKLTTKYQISSNLDVSFGPWFYYESQKIGPSEYKSHRLGAVAQLQWDF